MGDRHPWALRCADAGRSQHAARHLRAVIAQQRKFQGTLAARGQLFRTQIAEGLSGDPLAAGKARVVLREMFGRMSVGPGPPAYTVLHASTS